MAANKALSRAGRLTRLTFHAADPEFAIGRALSRKTAEELVPLVVLLQGHRAAGRPIRSCERCTGLMRYERMAGDQIMYFPMFACAACGERVDWRIRVNRFLTGIGCREPSDYEQGYRRLKLALLEREWRGQA